MDIIKRYEDSIPHACLPVLLTVMLGVMHGEATAAPQYFEAKAVLCAVSPNMFEEPDIKGNSGLLYKNDLVSVYQITSEDSALMRGWELMHMSFKQTNGGVQFYYGELEMTPELYADPVTATLVEKLRFKVEVGQPIVGTYTGTGALEGVTIEYVLTEYPYVCDSGDWYLACPDCVPFPAPYGYNVSGWIEGWTLPE